ncbi:probable methyltransferase TARBP1 [Microplitis mediator]|uniref:probable methyltransferase TARBP1 n=1 Tax=Microplitis mediator TaxID=375433 RepID=UPI002556BE64|nr:probable methyltransferase TARBP1 [Microplitis mediator]
MEKINNRDLLYKKTVVSPIDVIGILDDDFAADPLLVIHKIVNKYNKKIYQGFINEKIINGFYTVLCYEYNLKIDSTVSAAPVFDKSFFKNIVKYINENYEKEPREFIKIFYEIIVLQLKLYCSESELSNLCQDFIEHQSSIKDNNIEVYYQVIECFVDALWLKAPINHQELMGVCLLILEEVKCWFKKFERTDWKLFISLIMKVLQVFDHKIILESLWTMSGSNDWEKSLTFLSILIENILALPSDEMSSLNRDYCCAETLWQLIAQGLRSPVEQYRKQGLYCMKTILDFLDTRELPPAVSEIIPFIRCPKYGQEPAIKDLKSKFFLIMESLEEKQAHLVTPVLGHLERLIQLHVDHQSCANCFDSKWIQCIFERVLSHKTNGVIKSGVITLLQMDPRIYNEDLVTLLLNSLNATFIYDNPTPEPEPLVVKELAELFVKAESSQVALINQFVFLASTISWTPIPLFYVMSSLRKAGLMLNDPVECNVFTENELNSLESITDKYLNTQTSSLRNFFRDLIATVIFRFSIEPSLDSLAKIYHLFTRNEILHHSSISYCLLHKYIRNKLSTVAADDFVASGCHSLSGGKKINVKSSAQMMAILYDAGKIFPSSGSLSLEAFATTVNSLINLESRPYADKNNYLQAISLLSHFLNYFVQYDGHDDHKKMIYNKFILHIKSVLAFVVKTSKQTDNSLMEVEIYTQCFQVILKFFKKCDWFCPGDIWDYFDKIQDDTRQIIDHQSNDNQPINKIKLLFGLNILASIAEVVLLPNGLALQTMINLCQRPLISSDSQSNDRKVASDCYQLIAKIIYCLLAKSIQLDDNQEVLLSLIKLVDWGKESVICPVMKSLTSLVERRREFLIKDVSLVKSLVDDSWVNLWEMKRDSLFWESSICFIDCLMAIDALSDCLSMGVDAKNYVGKMNSRSQDIMGLKSLLWNRFRIPATNAINYWELIISNFVDGNSGRGDRKMEQQTYVFMLNNFSFKYCYYSNRYLDHYKYIYIDAFLRAELIFLFIAPVKANPDLFPEIEDRVVSVLLSALKAHQGKRYYGDSSLHRMKHRVMQLLLVIHPCLKEKSLMEIHEVIGECLIVESNQPTVRMMQEWLLIKLYLDYPEMVNKLWGLLERAKEERPGSITSIASIIYHVSKNISDENQQLFIKDAIYKLLSCAFSQQFVVRLYCQTVLSKLFDMIPSSEISNYDNLKKSIDESLLRGNMYKNSMKLSEDFYFTKFDPLKNYTLTTIFYDVPRLLNMAKDEWLLPEMLKEIFVDAPYEYERNIHIKINNEHTLENLQLPSQMTKTRCQELDEEDISSSDSATDVQKKMIPWKSIIPFDGDSTGITTLRRQKLADDAGLIVVASLIDSMANLGGLARTSEIFCAKQLVLGNMKYVENKEFQVLSVSAEKWVQITEVKAHELRDYLLEKSSLGWKIVGAEQTANSVCLTDMEFDKKTVLVLGNEKSGMPANLIPLMDVCVEIPQAGVVRSLNVHVTGAICMWQYAQQYIFK